MFRRAEKRIFRAEVVQLELISTEVKYSLRVIGFTKNRDPTPTESFLTSNGTWPTSLELNP